MLEAVEWLPATPGEPVRTRDLREHLAARIREEHAGSPILIFILLQIVLPIVVRLVIEWWLNRR